MASTMTSGGDGPAGAVGETAPCRKCEQQIPTDLETCPECEFNYGNSIAGTGLAIGAIGGFLTLLGAVTVITAFLGIPMVLVSPLIILYGLMTSKPAADVDGDGAESTMPWYARSFPQLIRERL